MKRAISSRSGSPVIARWSCGHGQQDPAEDEYVDLERTGIRKYVKEMRKVERRVLA
jgi:hypothetical protein